MIVAENVEALVPILVAIGDTEENREQVDERLAMAWTKISPQLDLPTVAIVLRDLLCPRVDHDSERNSAARQKIGQLGHVFQRSRNAALDAEGQVPFGIRIFRGPPDPVVIGIDRAPPVTQLQLNPSLDQDAEAIGDRKMIDQEIPLDGGRGRNGARRHCTVVPVSW